MPTHVHKIELSPYKAVNQYIDSVEKYAHETTRLLLRGVGNLLGLQLAKAKDLHAPLIFKGKIMYSPMTGKPITVGEWAKLEAAIAKFLKIENNVIKRKIVHDAFWLGSVLKRLNAEQRRVAQLKSFHIDKADFRKIDLEDYQKDLVATAEQASGTYLQNVIDRARAKIQSVLIEGTKQRKSSGKVFQDLWDQEEDINRDWERVVRTETATNANNGYLVATLNSSEKEYTFVKGISAPNACKYCKELVNDVVAVLLPSAPKRGGDSIVVNGTTYPAIWPGKSNVGRSARNYWAATTIHPYCRCVWTEWFVELEQYIKGGKK